MPRQKAALSLILAVALALAGCATGSGVGICRAKTEKELAAERQAGLHETFANGYRATNNDPYWVRYHDERAQQERMNAANEGNFWADVLFAIFGNCDR